LACWAGDAAGDGAELLALHSAGARRGLKAEANSAGVRHPGCEWGREPLSSGCRMARTERKAVLLQLYPTILDQIAGEIAKSPVRMSRQTWVELAIVEKLRRDQG